MRSINITQDIEEVLRQLVIAIPEVFLDYDVDLIELQVDDGSDYDEDRQVTIPTVWEIVFVESEDTELVLGEVVLMENFEAVIMIFED
jgi:hypothetical protein